MKSNEKNLWYLRPIARYPLILMLSVAIALFVYAYFFSSTFSTEDWSTLTIYLIIFGIPLFYLLSPKHFDNVKLSLLNLSNALIVKLWSLIRPFVYFLLFCLAIYFGYKIILATYNFIRPKTWTLMICEGEPMGDGGCYNNSYVLEGYKSQRECMEKGLAMSRISGFECGEDCRVDKEWGARVCKTLCNKGGCGN